MYSDVALRRDGGWRTWDGPRQPHGVRAGNRLPPFSGGRVVINAFATRTLSIPAQCKFPGGPHWSRGLGQAGSIGRGNTHPAAGAPVQAPGPDEQSGVGEAGPSQTTGATASSRARAVISAR